MMSERLSTDVRDPVANVLGNLDALERIGGARRDPCSFGGAPTCSSTEAFPLTFAPFSANRADRPQPPFEQVPSPSTAVGYKVRTERRLRITHARQRIETGARPWRT